MHGRGECVKKNIVFCLLLCLVLGVSCRDRSSHLRPAQVPATAVWVGGADGGVWIDCQTGKDGKSNYCKIFNENTGTIEAEGEFLLRGSHRPATREELRFNSFDGYVIRLEDGKVLEPIAGPKWFDANVPK